MNNTREIIQKIWGIIKTDSLASSRIGTPTEITIEKLSALLQEARQETKEKILKKIPELKVREIKLPQDDLRVLRARQYHNAKLLELSDFISSL